MQVRGTLSPARVEEVVGHLGEAVKPSLVEDVSNYAPGRTRVWLQREAPLGPSRPWGPGLEDPRLWAWLCRLWSASLPGVPDLGLAVFGSVGIRPHRDASYARPGCLLVNLGPVRWGIGARQGPLRADSLTWSSFEGGEVVGFDCKRPHGAEPASADRWGLVLWQVK